jgi:hypothetical protein
MMKGRRLGRSRQCNASASCGLYCTTHRLMGEGSTDTLRSCMQASTWRVLKMKIGDKTIN